MKYKLIVFFAIFILFLPIFRKGFIPFPGNYMIAWYEPWKSSTVQGDNLGIAHKPVADDVFRQIYPFKLLAAEQMRKGIWPLWNPYNGAGQPLLATMHTGILNPFSIWMILFPNGYGWTIFIMTQAVLLCVGMYLYIRSLHLSSCASLVATVIMLFSGFVTTRLVYGDYVYALSVLPFLLWIIESHQRKKYLLFPFFIALLIFSVQPQIIAYILLFTCIYAGFRLEKIQEKVNIFVLLLLGLGIAAIQLIPTIELYLHANVTPSSSSFIFDRFLLPLPHLISLFIPNYFGNQGTYNYWGAGDYVETIASVGLIPIFLALISWRKRKTNSLVYIYIGTIIVTMILTLRWFGTQAFYKLPLPIISTSIPTRIFMLTAFAICILSAIGIDAWQKEHFAFTSIKKPVYILFSIIAIIGIYTFFQYLHHGICPSQISNCRMIAVRNTALEVGIFLFFFVMLNLFQHLYHKRSRNEFGMTHMYELIILIIILTGWYNSTKFFPFSPKETMYPNTPLIQFVQSKTDGRVVGIGQAALSSDIATQLKIQDPNYYDPLYIKRYGELVSYANTDSLSQGLTRSDALINTDATPTADIQEKRERLWNILSVKYVIEKKSELPTPLFGQSIWEDTTWRVIERKTSLPFVYFVPNTEELEGKFLAQRLFDPSFEPGKEVLTEQIRPPIENGKAVSSTHVGPPLLKAGDITVSGEASTAGWLVVSQSWYPRWKATINGRDTPVFRANYAFMAIPISQGVFSLSLSYSPIFISWGIWLSSLSILSVFVWYYVKKH